MIYLLLRQILSMYPSLTCVGIKKQVSLWYHFYKINFSNIYWFLTMGPTLKSSQQCLIIYLACEESWRPRATVCEIWSPSHKNGESVWAETTYSKIAQYSRFRINLRMVMIWDSQGYYRLLPTISVYQESQQLQELNKRWKIIYCSIKNERDVKWC